MKGLKEATLTLAFTHTRDVPICSVTLKGHAGDENKRFSMPVAMVNVNLQLPDAFSAMLAGNLTTEWEFSDSQGDDNLVDFLQKVRGVALNLSHHLAGDGVGITYFLVGIFNDKLLNEEWDNRWKLALAA